MAKENHLGADSESEIYEFSRSIEAIAATCGLIHDLGNPPFGHAGEEAIQNWFATRFTNGELDALVPDEQMRMDLLKFDGNPQTIRLVARLQVLADYSGLNLTFGTLSALRKYTAASNATDKSVASRKKAGYFASEKNLIHQCEERTGTGSNRNPITLLVEAADDIVYSVADVEDAVKKRVMSWSELKQYLGEGPHDLLEECFDSKGKILASAAHPGRLADDVHASAFRTAAIGVMVRRVVTAWQENYKEIMDGSLSKSLMDISTAAPLYNHLKDKIAVPYIYTTKPTLKLEMMGRRVIQELMDVFYEGTRELNNSSPGKGYPAKPAHLISRNYRDVFDHAVNVEGLPLEYARFQLVTDYVCGMTDTFAKTLHTELFNG